jgi:hypothetical protein
MHKGQLASDRTSCRSPLAKQKRNGHPRSRKISRRHQPAGE